MKTQAGLLLDIDIRSIIQNNRTRKNLVAFNGGKNFGNIFLNLMKLLISFGTIESAQVNLNSRNSIMESGCTDEGRACFKEDTCCPGLVCKWYTVGPGTCVKNVF